MSVTHISKFKTQTSSLSPFEHGNMIVQSPLRIDASDKLAIFMPHADPGRANKIFLGRVSFLSFLRNHFFPSNKPSANRKGFFSFLKEYFFPSKFQEADEDNTPYLTRSTPSGAVLHFDALWRKKDEASPVHILEITKRTPFPDRFCLETLGGIIRDKETPEKTLDRMVKDETALNIENAAEQKQAFILNTEPVAKSPAILGELEHSGSVVLTGEHLASDKDGIVGYILVPHEVYIDNQKFEDFLNDPKNFIGISIKRSDKMTSPMTADEYKNMTVGMDVPFVRGEYINHQQALKELEPLLQKYEFRHLTETLLGKHSTDLKENQLHAYQTIEYPRRPDLSGVAKEVFRNDRVVVYAPLDPQRKDDWFIDYSKGKDPNGNISKENGATAAIHVITLYRPDPNVPANLDNVFVILEENFREPVGKVLEFPAGRWENWNPEHARLMDAINDEITSETGHRPVKTTLMSKHAYGTSLATTLESKIFGLTEVDKKKKDQNLTESEKKTIKDLPKISLRDFLNLEALQRTAQEKHAILGSDLIAAHGLITKSAFQRIGLTLDAQG